MKVAYDILLVHRELAVIQRLGGELRSAGYRLYVARSGAACADVAANVGLDLILSDATALGDEVESMYRSRNALGAQVPPLLVIVANPADASIVARFTPRVVDFVQDDGKTLLLLNRVRSYAELGRLRRRLDRRPDMTGEDLARRGDDERIGRLLTREADVRRELASRLHDTALQELAVAKLQIQLAASNSSNTDVNDGLLRAEDALGRSILELRELMFDLAPPVFSRSGIDDALESLAAQITTRWGIGFYYECDETHEELASTSQLLLLQSLWELIRNTIDQPG